MWLPDTPQDTDNREREVEFVDEWIPQLEKVMADWQRSWGNLPYALPLRGSTGLECWRSSFEDGMTPQDAFWSDQENWK